MHRRETRNHWSEARLRGRLDRHGRTQASFRQAERAIRHYKLPAVRVLKISKRERDSKLDRGIDEPVVERPGHGEVNAEQVLTRQEVDRVHGDPTGVPVLPVRTVEFDAGALHDQDGVGIGARNG